MPYGLSYPSWTEIHQLTELDRFDQVRDPTYTVEEVRHERNRRWAEDRETDEQKAKGRGRPAEERAPLRQSSKPSDRSSRAGTSKLSERPLDFGGGFRKELDAIGPLGHSNSNLDE